MDTKKLIAKVSVIGVLTLWISGIVFADNLVPSFINYQDAQANVNWRYLTNEGEELAQGVFQVTLPDTFSLIVENQDGIGQRINGFQDLVTIHTSGAQPQYNYDSIQLFTVYKMLFGKLIELPNQPLTYLGDESVGGRHVSRYQSDSYIYWFDRETNIPIRVSDNAGNNRLSLRQYQVDANHKSGVESFTLMSHNPDWEGIIRLGRFNDHWFPTELQVGDEQTQIIVTFSDWELLNSPIEFVDLKKMVSLLTSVDEAVDQGDHQQIVQLMRRILIIDPYYLPAYIHLAISYDQLANHLGVVESYQQWLMLEPDNAVALNNLAYTYMLADSQLSYAISLAYQAVLIDPQPTYLDTLGYGYYLVKDYDKALHYLLQAVENSPTEILIEPLTHLIKVYQALELEEQVDYYEKKLIKITTERSYD